MSGAGDGFLIKSAAVLLEQIASRLSKSIFIEKGFALELFELGDSLVHR